MSYIIKPYNKYNSWDRTHKHSAFILNDSWYGIFKYDGTLPVSMERDDSIDNYKIYKSIEAAMEYIRLMRHLSA